MKKYRLHWSLIPGRDQAWMDNEIATKYLTEDVIAREYEINYALSVSGKVFSAFRADRHVTNKFTWNPSLPVYRIFDFGKTNCTLFVQRDVYGRTSVLHERVLEGSSTTEQKRVALNDSFNLFPDAEFLDICDPAGSYEDHREATPDVQILEGLNDDPEDDRIMPEYQRILELPTKERKKRGRSLITKDLQETPAGVEAFQIYCGSNETDGCPILKKAFQGGYCYKKDVNGNITDRIQEQHPYEDPIDCLIYYYLETTGNYGPKQVIEPWSDDDYINPYTGL